MGGPSILVVDDDSGVRGLVADVLSVNGYKVWQAEGGAQALEILKRECGIDLVLTDIVMPDMSGTQLGHRIREVRPSLPVAYMSGFSDSAADTLQNAETLLLKPFGAHEIVGFVQRLLAPQTP